MDTIQKANPFAKRETHDRSQLIAYRILTILSWLLIIITSVYYTFNAPNDGKYHRGTIWGQNSAHQTPFSLNKIITSVYWIVLFVGQVGYVWHLFVSNQEYLNAAANVGSHSIVNNLFGFAFIMLWVRSHFWLAELMLLLNFFNLSSLYFRHSNYPLAIHVPVVSGPLAFTYVAILWCGAAMVNAHTLAARILANIAIWGILVYGMFFLAAFKDYTIGFELSVLTASLGVHQFLVKAIAFQWIFAFIIMGILFCCTIAIALPGMFGTDTNIRQEGRIVSEDRERAPLLDDH